MARLTLQTNAEQILRRMEARRDAMESALESAAREAARGLLRHTKETLQQEVYNVPIPTTATGKPKWRRTGRLLRAEMTRADKAAIVLRNATRYALYRHRLGTPAGRQIRSPGIRSIQWHDRVAAEQGQYVREVRRRAVLKILRRR